MDSLPPSDSGTAQKMSTTRLMLKLGKAGYDDGRLYSGVAVETLAEAIIVQSETEQADLPGRPRRHQRSLSQQGILAVLPQKAGVRCCGSGS